MQQQPGNTIILWFVLVVGIAVVAGVVVGGEQKQSLIKVVRRMQEIRNKKWEIRYKMVQVCINM